MGRELQGAFLVPIFRRRLNLLPAQSCEDRVYVQSETSQVVNTAFAIIGLLAAKCEDHEALRRGCRLIMSRQLPDGSWAQENIEGGELHLARSCSVLTRFPFCPFAPVFNHTCGISYPNFVSIKAVLQPAPLLRRGRRADSRTRNSFGVFGRSERLRRSLERLGGSCHRALYPLARYHARPTRRERELAAAVVLFSLAISALVVERRT